MSDRCTAGDTDAWLRGALDAALEGALLAYPTETSWGLGASVAIPSAVERVRRFKGDRGEKPFSVLIRGASALDAAGFALPPDARRLADQFWPGPLTLVLPCDRPWATTVGRPDGAVAVRCSPHPVARALAAGVETLGLAPLTATSLNRSGEPPARHRRDAEEACADGACTLAAPAGADAGGAPDSTIVDCSGARVAVLREGALRRNQLEPWVRLA